MPQLEDRIRELNRHLGRKLLEAKILREALVKSYLNTDFACAVAADKRFPMKVVTEALGMACSNLVDRLKGRTKPRRRYYKTPNWCHGSPC